MERCAQQSTIANRERCELGRYFEGGRSSRCDDTGGRQPEEGVHWHVSVSGNGGDGVLPKPNRSKMSAERRIGRRLFVC